MNKPSLLVVADACCPTGFAKATHNIIEHLLPFYKVTVLGLNYWGDPYTWPYKVFSCFPGGDSAGIGRLIWMCDECKPDVILIQNDGWNIQQYIRQLRNTNPNGSLAFPEYANVPVVTALAVDGKNFKGRWLDHVTHAIFWTQFALDEARAGGYTGPADVIPLGVNLDDYVPGDKGAACDAMGLQIFKKMFVVGNINRNQPRKRWDLTLRYFAEWTRLRQVRDAALYLHVAPTGDMGIDVEQMARYYGIFNRLVLMKTAVGTGASEAEMATVYRLFDVQISTTQGEGMGLTTMEGMACGIPQIVPDWSALGDWAREGVQLVPCTSVALNPVTPSLNVIGGVADEGAFIEALDTLYRDRDKRSALAARGRALVERPEFRWSMIGDRVRGVLDGVLAKRVAVVTAEEAAVV